MTLNKQKVLEIIKEEDFVSEEDILKSVYCSPNIKEEFKVPVASVFPHDSDEILNLMRIFRNIKDINVVILSSNATARVLNPPVRLDNTVIMDLSKMKNMSFINKKNRVCVIESGVKFEEYAQELKKNGMRPLAPFLPLPGKSVLASALERTPHMNPKKQWDISDPLLCLEVIFGNGKLFRTGESAGPQSIEKNREFGAALTNPTGPGQLDLFRILQGSRGSYGAVSWASMQIDEIPKKRVVNFIEENSTNKLVDFIYQVVRRRWIDEVFLINNTLFKAIFPSVTDTIKKYLMIYSINGYEGFLPEEKVEYQYDNCVEVLNELGLESKENIANISSQEIIPILDGIVLESHPKISNTLVPIEIYYDTTLDRIQNQLDTLEKFLIQHEFPLERLYIYAQPVIQARSVEVQLTLMADTPSTGSQEFPVLEVRTLVKEMAKKITQMGGFFSHSNDLTDEIAFSTKSKNNEIYINALLKLKQIFDPDKILNNGVMVF